MYTRGRSHRDRAARSPHQRRRISRERRAAAADHRAGARGLSAARDRAHRRLSISPGRPRDDRRHALLRRGVRAGSRSPDKSSTLFRGRAWIAADSFAMVKVSAAQTGLRGADRRIRADRRIPAGSGRCCGCWRGPTFARCTKGRRTGLPSTACSCDRVDEINAPDFQRETTVRLWLRVRDASRHTAGYRYSEEG